MRLLRNLAEARHRVATFGKLESYLEAEVNVRAAIWNSPQVLIRAAAAAFYAFCSPLFLLVVMVRAWPRMGPLGMPKGLIIDLLVPPERADDMLANLERAYDERWLPKYGARKARCIFLLQATGAVAGFWIDWVRQRLDLIKLFAR